MSTLFGATAMSMLLWCSSVISLPVLMSLITTISSSNHAAVAMVLVTVLVVAVLLVAVYMASVSLYMYVCGMRVYVLEILVLQLCSLTGFTGVVFCIRCRLLQR